MVDKRGVALNSPLVSSQAIMTENLQVVSSVLRTWMRPAYYRRFNAASQEPNNKGKPFDWVCLGHKPLLRFQFEQTSVRLGTQNTHVIRMGLQGQHVLLTVVLCVVSDIPLSAWALWATIGASGCVNSSTTRASGARWMVW